MKTVKIIVVGFGTIGKGVLEVLCTKRRYVQDRYGADLQVVAVCEYNGTLVNPKGIDIGSALEYAQKGKLKDHPDWKPVKSLDAIKDIEADIVLELTPGDIKTGEPGLSHITAALESGKNVVTSNKAPLLSSSMNSSALRRRRGWRSVMKLRSAARYL
jgi:homoserine dehydrogenase